MLDLAESGHMGHEGGWHLWRFFGNTLYMICDFSLESRCIYPSLDSVKYFVD